MTTPSGMVLDGSLDDIEIPGPDPSGVTEVATSLVDFFGFYLMNYRHAPGFPQAGHGSISLTVLFEDPTDIE